ncbi:MAG: hypothetical protein ACI3ZF_05910 [Candidatus Cryptobacteroides sp.]
MNKIINLEIGTLPLLSEQQIPSYEYGDLLEILILKGTILNEITDRDISIPIKTNAWNIILTVAGSAHFEVDTECYELKADSSLNLIGPKVLQNVTFTEDYRGYHIIVKNSYYDDIFKEGRHLTPDTAMYKTHSPYDQLSSEDSHILENRILELIKTIKNKEHLWYSKMVESQVKIFLMEIGNILYTKLPSDHKGSLAKFRVCYP